MGSNIREILYTGTYGIFAGQGIQGLSRGDTWPDKEYIQKRVRRSVSVHNYFFYFYPGFLRKRARSLHISKK